MQLRWESGIIVLHEQFLNEQHTLICRHHTVTKSIDFVLDWQFLALYYSFVLKYRVCFWRNNRDKLLPVASALILKKLCATSVLDEALIDSSWWPHDHIFPQISCIFVHRTYAHSYSSFTPPGLWWCGLSWSHRRAS